MLKLNGTHHRPTIGGEPQLLRQLCEEWLEAIKRGEVPDGFSLSGVSWRPLRAMLHVGTFATFRRTLKRSADGERREVAGQRSERRD
jgi:hypothetical protein